MGGEKLSMGGEGQVTYIVHVPRGQAMRSMTLFFEAGAKRVLQKDRHIVGKAEVDHAFMRGYCVDRGSFDNSYWMTDETRFPSTVEVLVDDQVIDTLYLRNDWCDARGMLSWHAQPNDRLLDEAGSYGEAQRIKIPANLLPGIVQEGRFALTFRVKGSGGLALYGRESGRYGYGMTLKVEK